MKTVDIKGKAYVMVNERITYFRENYPEYSLTSEILHIDDKSCVIRAAVLKDGIEVASGHAREVNGDSFINKTSYVENCETSAWGRALACMGIGIDASMASADEVANAITQQNKPKQTPEQLGLNSVNDVDLEHQSLVRYVEQGAKAQGRLDKLKIHYKVKEVKDMTTEQLKQAKQMLDKEG